MHYGCCNVCNLILDAFAALLFVGWFALLYLMFWLLTSMLIGFVYDCMIRRAMRRLKKEEASE
jgi:hypothetical protein